MLILLPNLLDENGSVELLPIKTKKEVLSLDGLVAESEKSARKYLMHFLNKEDANKLRVEILSEHTERVEDLLEFVKDGKWGVISDCGLPSIADPGAKLVELCNKNNIEVKALLGPSSIILALLLSGFCSQRFCFHGYLPRKQDELIRKLKHLEKLSYKNDMTHIFIEAPYRSKKIFDLALKSLSKNTRFCIAADLDTKNEMVISKRISEFPKKIDLKKNRAVFLIYAGK